MDHINLPSPFRRDSERRPEAYPYTVLETSYLPKPSIHGRINFFDTLEARKSRREGEMPTLTQISDLLWHSAKTRGTSTEDSGFLWQHRPSPSGGGRHPIDILICNYQRNPEFLYLYEPLSHSLARLGGIEKERLKDFTAAVSQVLPVGDAIIVWFAGQFDRTLSKYADGESLVWLDAGALLATVYLVAEALQLNCCAIGITGEPWISRMLSAAPLAEGVGGCLLWARDKQCT